MGVLLFNSASPSSKANCCLSVSLSWKWKTTGLRAVSVGTASWTQQFKSHPFLFSSSTSVFCNTEMLLHKKCAKRLLPVVPDLWVPTTTHNLSWRWKGTDLDKPPRALNPVHREQSCLVPWLLSGVLKQPQARTGSRVLKPLREKSSQRPGTLPPHNSSSWPSCLKSGGN